MTASEFYESIPRDIYIFLEEKSTEHFERIEQEWDYVRHLMCATMNPHITTPKEPYQLIPLKRDGAIRRELSPYENQALREWSAKCDEGMNLVPLFPNKTDNAK